MKLTSSIVLTGLIWLSNFGAATAQDISTQPPIPSPGQSFTIEFDYTSNNICTFLATPGVLVLGQRILIFVGRLCTETSAPQTRHIVAIVPALAAGRYSVYGSISLQSGFDPPPEVDTLEGSIFVGAQPAPSVSPAPTTSAFGLIALCLVVLVLAARVLRGRQHDA
jgi:hypothetical protein